MKRVEFLSCQIDLSKHSFSPRTETEFWVREVIRKITKIKNLEALDIFAGTGCIGISILKTCSKVVQRVDFIDIWLQATEQIKINLKLNKIKESRYMVYQSNLFEKLNGQKYDFIFANPPYVALDRIAEVEKEVLEKEPLAALFSGKDGMVIIEKFLNQVKDYLKPAGKIFLEFDPFQKKKIEKIVKKEGIKVVFRKDQFGKCRWLEAKIP
ncbi:MAG: HemK family protein methyltransferase [Parcubacteria group bacterium]